MQHGVSTDHPPEKLLDRWQGDYNGGHQGSKRLLLLTVVPLDAIMNLFVLSQMLVAMAFVCDIVSFQFRDRKTILACLVASTGLSSAHYFLLLSPSAGCLMLLAAARFSVAYLSKHRWWMWFFMGVATVVLFVTYRVPANLVAFFASVLMTFASFQDSDKTLRLWMMGGTTAWLIHNILIGSPAAVILEAFFLGSNLFGFWRFYLKIPQRSDSGAGT